MDGEGANSRGIDSDRRMRCALFVDFDNVYLGLRQLDPPAAEAFANDPARWLEQLEPGRDAEGEYRRRFLVRACYLNPSVFARFRPFFTRAGFRVIDCPSLTQQGKSSADINMVLDAVDALNAPTRYDEFVIVSADADFTPLALRCRAADRRVTIITAGPAASAYRAVADSVLTADDLAEMLTTRPAVMNEPALDASRLAKKAALAPFTSKGGAEPPRPVRDEAADAVLRLLRSASGPVVGAALAQTARAVDPTLPASSWDGHGGFASWLAANVPDAAFSSRHSPGYGWDRTRFTEADLPAGEAAELTPLQRQVADVTDIPPLSTEQYATLLNALTRDVNAHPFHRTETSKRVRDTCQVSGVAVGRASINWVIQSLLYSGVKLQQPVTIGQLATGWAGNVEGLCHGARMELNDEGLTEVRTWVGGGQKAST